MRYFFINKEIYFQNKKMPDRKEELFNVTIDGNDVYGNDEDGNDYHIDIKELIMEEDSKDEY